VLSGAFDSKNALTFDSALYEGFGYVRESERDSGLTRGKKTKE
jgi:hypothetical protein